MLETIILLAFCSLMGLAALAVLLWLVLSGTLLTMDGLVFALISLTVGGFFMFNVAWSLRTGELRALLSQLGKKTKPESEEKSREANSK